MKIEAAYFGPPAGAAAAASHARRAGWSGLWLAETGHDPFLGSLVAAQAEPAPDFTVGTGIAVGLARSPMTLAQTAWDLAALSHGRFMLGLGTQVKAHITRRFSMPWTRPVAQMKELIAALRAIWSAFRGDTPRLDFVGEHYRLNLLTPFFTPAPHPWSSIPVGLAAVGPDMTRLAGAVADFVVLHAFTHRRFLEQVTLPALRAGAAAADRPAENVERVGALFVITGDAAQQARMRGAVRAQLSFYASTPAYAEVLECLGMGELHTRLHAMSRRGEWQAMAEALPEELVDELSLTAPPGELADAIRRRFAGLYDRVVVQMAPDDLAALTKENK